VKFAIELGLEIDVFGSGWSQFIDKKFIKGEFVKNEELHKLYNNYEIILNDHWDDMLTYGYVSNRIFDALACGAQIISDRPIGAESIFPNLHYYNDRQTFLDCVLKLREANESSTQINYEVLNKHTFQHRAIKILNQYQIEKNV